jgi:hypothetical protein
VVRIFQPSGVPKAGLGRRGVGRAKFHRLVLLVLFAANDANGVTLHSKRRQNKLTILLLVAFLVFCEFRRDES